MLVLKRLMTLRVFCIFRNCYRYYREPLVDMSLLVEPRYSYLPKFIVNFLKLF